MVVFNTGCVKYVLHSYTACYGKRRRSKFIKFKRNNFVHWHLVWRAMKISSTLIVCVGCLTILQTNSLGNIIFKLLLQNRMLIFENFDPSYNSVIIINRSLENCCCAYLNYDESFIYKVVAQRYFKFLWKGNSSSLIDKIKKSEFQKKKKMFKNRFDNGKLTRIFSSEINIHPWRNHIR